MSYDPAVWEGDRPVDDKTADRVFSDLYDRYIDSDVEEPATDRIAAYVAALPERWCDLTEDEEDTSPWSTGPLLGDASGPLLYFVAEETSAYAVSVADSMDLVCFDVREDRLRP
ncbi:hypothetical protein [Streptomyces sp. NPDC054797]